MNKASNGWPIKARIVHKPIRQRPHEENERVLFCIRQTQTTNVARVHVGDRLRRWAAGRTFARIMGLALSKLPQCSYCKINLPGTPPRKYPKVNVHRPRRDN